MTWQLRNERAPKIDLSKDFPNVFIYQLLGRGGIGDIKLLLPLSSCSLNNKQEVEIISGTA